RDGTVGERNAVRCGAIEHKMGIHGSATCVMNFDGAEGYLVGQPHKGLQAMFVMMNSARLGVGVQGLGLSERAYQNALRYARERLQSRALSGPKYPDKPADPLIVQPDVRRMLLTQKALIEGGRLLSMHAYSLLDVAEKAGDAGEREHAETLVSWLTPISKACLTEWSIENTYNALQCFGGHGYIHEHGMEQYARDARITTLYEGTTGIQSLDLIGRKTAATQGAGLKLFLAEVETFAKQHEGDAALAEFIAPLRAKCGEWGKLTQDVLQRASANPEELGAASTDYLLYSGYVVLAYWWARSVAAANASDRPQAFKDAKRDTARFYFARVLPRTLAHKAVIDAGADPLMALPDAGFGPQ
ncbi:MAG: acyl-CoA dehydrogenase C-terminal domain-containing protein, partial [Thermomonas sp.]